jgi:hypothetical protein
MQLDPQRALHILYVPPDGEWSSAIALADLTPLSPEQFDAARASGWLTPSS